jgi:hypothetical protein
MAVFECGGPASVDLQKIRCPGGSTLLGARLPSVVRPPVDRVPIPILEVDDQTKIFWLTFLEFSAPTIAVWCLVAWNPQTWIAVLTTKKTKVRKNVRSKSEKLGYNRPPFFDFDTYQRCQATPRLS